MDKSNFKTFNEYWEEIRPKQVALDMRSEEEIMNEILSIQDKFRKEE